MKIETSFFDTTSNACTKSTPRILRKRSATEGMSKLRHHTLHHGAEVIS